MRAPRGLVAPTMMRLRPPTEMPPRMSTLLEPPVCRSEIRWPSRRNTLKLSRLLAPTIRLFDGSAGSTQKDAGAEAMMQ